MKDAKCRLTGMQIGWQKVQTDLQAGRQTSWQKERPQLNRRVDRQADRLTDWQAGRQADKQTDRETTTHTNKGANRSRYGVWDAGYAVAFFRATEQTQPSGTRCSVIFCWLVTKAEADNILKWQRNLTHLHTHTHTCMCACTHTIQH